MNPYLTPRANRRWWVYPLMALFFALSALLLWRTCKAGEHGDTRMVVLLLCLATAALYAGMHLLQGEIIRRRARGVAQQLATFSLHMFPLSDMPKLLPDCPNMETLRLLLCGNYLRNIQIDPLTAMVYLTAPNLRAYGAIQSLLCVRTAGGARVWWKELRGSASIAGWRYKKELLLLCRSGSFCVC